MLSVRDIGFHVGWICELFYKEELLANFPVWGAPKKFLYDIYDFFIFF